MFKQIFWKEWRYQRWKVVFGTVMLIFFTGTLWAARVTTDHEVYIVMWMLGSLVLSLFSATGAFASETTDGTRTFLVAKPVRPWKVFWAKWLMGWLNFAVPLLICGLVITLTILFRSEDRSNELELIARGTTAAIGFGTMLYTMTCCFAPRKGSEAAVGLTGFFVILGIVFHVISIDLILPVHVGWLDDAAWFLNPISWIELIDSLGLDYEWGLLITMQSFLFAISAIVGYRKWKRS